MAHGLEGGKSSAGGDSENGCFRPPQTSIDQENRSWHDDLARFFDQANHEHRQRTECPQSVVLQCGSRDRTEDAAHDRRERHSAGTDPDSALPPVVAKVNTVAGTTIEPNKIMEGRKLGFCVANSVRSGSKYAPMPASKTQANRAGTECVVGRHQKPRLPAQRGESPR
jgi:hypothetical protein